MNAFSSAISRVAQQNQKMLGHQKTTKMEETVKSFASFGFIAVVMALTALTASPSFAASDLDFCWKDTSTRGVGAVPQSCPGGKEMVGLFCYDKCPAGMERVGIDCHTKCPSGMDDQGLFCRTSEYPRGAGYPWEFGDALGLSRASSRCEADEGKDQCEKWGAVFYPKCRVGYSNFGCCICRPDVKPNCEQLGMAKGNVDLSCAKRIAIASSPKVGNCEAGQEVDAGLCYYKCPAGYYGVGPVCWKRVPLGWIECGMGAARTDLKCAAIMANQLYQVGRLAMTAATFGSSMVATKVATGADDVSKFKALLDQYEALVKAYEALKQPGTTMKTALETAEHAYSVGSTGWRINTAATTYQRLTTETDIARFAAQIAQIVDPSGVAGTIGAFTHDKCGKLFPDETSPWFWLTTESGGASRKLKVALGVAENKYVEITPAKDQGPVEVQQAQSWRAESQSDGTVRLKTAFRGSGVCLGLIDERNKGFKDQPMLQPCSDNSPGQRWTLAQDGSWDRLKTRGTTFDGCLNYHPDPGNVELTLVPCSDTAEQHWRIDPSAYKGPGAGGWTP